MALEPGTNLGAYRILSLLGTGGMGEVYRAKDTKLGRDVALKILPATFTTDPERAARFRREAQVLASLNHPHIAQIHGLDEANGTQFLVLELVDGESLDKRIARGRIPVDAALAIAREIAEALEAAHGKGIIHRDLKPGNIALMKDGAVKVLDFGLAKVIDVSPNDSAVTVAATREGTVLGTAAYMSPEQVCGDTVDRRSDVWAFGCVVFEMLAGSPAFEGRNASEILGHVLRGLPNWATLPADAQSLSEVLQQCFERDVTRRLRDVSDVILLLERERARTPADRAGREPRGWAAWRAALAALIGVVVGVTLVTIVGRSRTNSAPATIERVELAPSPTNPLASEPYGANVAISPDGSRVVYTTMHNGVSQLVVRRLDQLDAMPLAGTEGGFAPFFSPDGEHIGFATFTQLKRVPTAGGPSVAICPVDAYFSHASWGPDNTIVFAQGALGLFRVFATGGSPERIAAPKSASQEQAYASPLFLPDGRAVLYTAVLTDGSTRIVSRRFGAPDAATVVEGGFGPHYLTAGYLVYGDADRVVGARFDMATLRIIGSPAVLQDRVLAKVADRVIDIATANTGTVVYVSGRSSSGFGRIVWVDRTGVRAGRAVDQVFQEPRFLHISPDGRRLVVVVGPGGQGQIWVYDLTGAAQPLKLTFADHNLFPVWSPDGREILFTRRTASDMRLFKIRADGSAVQPEPVATAGDVVAPLPVAWMPDGSVVLETGTPQAPKLWLLPSKDGKPTQWLRTPFAEYGASVSSSGSWIAYASNQTGASEVWVRPFPGPGAPVRVSSDGGSKPIWSRNGREIFFENGPKVLAARVTAEAPEFRIEPPRVLFEGDFVRDDTDPHIRYMDVAADGRFLMVERTESAGSTSIVIAHHWDEDLKRLIRN